MSLRDFRIICKLGEGAYSNVYKVKRIEDNTEYALKKVNLSNLKEKEKQNALNEVRILASIRHPNIISYKEAFIDSNSLCIVMELAENGDLYQKIQKCIKTSSYIKESEIMKSTYQLASALKALHELKIFHRDLKSANVFLQQNGDVKLGDLNVSKVAKQGLLYTQTGTPYYASPEVWKDLPYDSKSDVWSLGCVVYEMASLRPPFKAEDMEGLYKRVIRGLYPRIPQQYSQDLSNIIRMMLQVQTNLRPTSNAILELPYFYKYRRLNCEIEEPSKLLNTINFPKNHLQISLPKANYSPIKQKTEAICNSNGDLHDSQPRRRHLSTLGSNQQSPNPTRISQYIHLDPDMLINQQILSVNQGGRQAKKVNQSEQNVIGKLLQEYERELNRVSVQQKKQRRVSQEDINSKKGQLPPLDECSPIVRLQHKPNINRYGNIPNNNLPVIAQ